MASTGSPALDRIVERLGSASEPKRRYEYVLWLAKKLEPLPEDFRQDAFKVKGCVSQVYVVAQLQNGRLHWQGDSDAAITKGLLALLIEGLEGLEPAQAASLDPAFLAETGLQASLTPSRANGFLNILAMMKAQARALQAGARGFVNKESADTVLLEALKAVGEGHVYLDQLSLDALAGQLVQIPDGAIDSQKGLGLLTAREHEVFALLLAGQSVKSIAFQLGISPKTADNHKAAVYTKLKVSGPVELVQFAQAHQLI
jgi:cysteine desulfuration protein SufE